MSEVTSELLWFYFYKYESSTVLGKKKQPNKVKPFDPHFQTFITAYKNSHQN